jgi:CheY-like chemotaxis protein
MLGEEKAALKKIIVAHDLVSLLTEKSSFLNRADIKVFTAATNDELLKIHSTELAGLIIASLEMPGVRTEELFAIMREREALRGVSTIIICKDTLAHRERCKQCRANAVFTMPVDSVLLSLKAQQFLNIAPRKSYRATLAVAIEGKFKDRPRPFRTENISSKGMLIRSEEHLAKGDGIFFSFFLPDGTHVSGYGEISRVARFKSVSDPGFYGIRFTNIEPADQAVIDAFVRK